MARITADRVLETTTTTGTGTLTLAGAVTGYRSFGSVCANNDTAYYSIWGVDGSGVPTGEWECGLGTWGTGGVLTRTTVHSSSNSNTAVNFSAGTKRVALTATATNFADYQAALISGTNIKTVNGSSLLGSGNLTVAGGSGPIDPSPVVIDFEFLATTPNAFPSGSPTVFPLDSDREFLDFGNGHCVVYNRTTKSIGAVAAYRSANTSVSYCCVVDANTVIVASVGITTTAFEVVGITISGTTCSVGTPATSTLAGGLSSFGTCIMVGSTAIFSYSRATTTKVLRAVTISGNTVTVGSEVTLTGTTGVNPAIVEAHASDLLIAFHEAGATTYASPYTVSGTTLTLGTEASVTLTSGSAAYRLGGKLSTDRYLVGSTSSALVAFASVSGTTASWSATSTMGSSIDRGQAVVISGSYVFMRPSTGASVYVLVQDTGSGAPSIIQSLAMSFSFPGVLSGTEFISPVGVNFGRLKVDNTSAPTAIVFEYVNSDYVTPIGTYSALAGNRFGYLSNGVSQVFMANGTKAAFYITPTTGQFCQYFDGSNLKTTFVPLGVIMQPTPTRGTSYCRDYSAMWLAGARVGTNDGIYKRVILP